MIEEPERPKLRISKRATIIDGVITLEAVEGWPLTLTEGDLVMLLGLLRADPGYRGPGNAGPEAAPVAA